MKKRRVGIIATVLVLALIAGVLMLATNRSGRAVTKAIADLKALGYATTMAEFAPPVPEAENAASLYAQAFRDFDATAYAKPDVTKRLRAGQLPTAAKIASLEPVLALTREAAQRPRCQFPYDWSDPIAVSFKEYAEFKKLWRALRVRAIARASTGDASGAFDDIQTLIATTDHVGQGRMLIAGLVQISGRATALSAIEEVVTKLGPSSAVLTRARQLVAGMKPVQPKDQFSGEILFLRATVDSLAKASPGDSLSLLGGQDAEPSLGTQAFTLATKVPSLLNEMDLACLNTYIELSRAMPSDPEDVMGMMKASTGVERELSAKMAAKDVRYALASMIMPGFGGFASTFGMDVARRRALTCLLDGIGKTPRPTGLVTRGKNATDPYTGKPMVVRSSAKEYVVYSVGPDGRDDGGDPRPSFRNDIVSYYPRTWTGER